MLISLITTLGLVFFQNSQDNLVKSPRNANYTISVKLNPETKELLGTETLVWRNITSKSTRELWFHLYLNAFSHMRTTFASESSGQLRGDQMSKKDFSWQRITALSVNGVDMLKSIEFVQPDDGNKLDSTVVKIMLNAEIKSGETVTIKLDFHAKLPRVFARTGFVNEGNTKEYFLVGQWFPKLGVLEENGWNCHQFHGNTEFFSDYGIYDVRLTTPKRFVVGATGLLQKKEETDSNNTYNYLANDVHDFAWTAYPSFKEANDTYKGKEIRLLYNDDQTEKEVENQIQSFKYGLDYYESHFGPYAHPNITIVNPPEGADGSGGMEYPTFITAGFSGSMPDGIPFASEMVTIHEFGHQIFQGILGSNEFEHSWLDEGLNSYGDAGTIDTYYGYAVNTYFFKLKMFDLYRIAYLGQPNHESVMTISYTQDRRNYGLNSYMRPAVLMRTLENYVGSDVMYNAMRAYYQKWKFGHPYPNDLFTSLKKNIPQDIEWYIQQFFYENKTIDYSIVNLSSPKTEAAEFVFAYGIQEAPGFMASDSAKGIYLNKVDIRNFGNGYFPMELEVTLADSSKINNLVWDYKQGYQSVQFYANSKVIKAQLDPNRKVLIDLHYSNNGYTRDDSSHSASNKYANALMFIIENIVQLMLGI
jgi:hypothetical protein